MTEHNVFWFQLSEIKNILAFIILEVGGGGIVVYKILLSSVSAIQCYGLNVSSRPSFFI